MTGQDKALPIAIIGGGLCGLALAIALRRRSIPFVVYEARASFSELGAGINLGPNMLEAFRLIDPSLGEEVQTLFTRNPPGMEDVWMLLRMGAETTGMKDGQVIGELKAPPTGNATVRRSELLDLLARRAGTENARLGMKLVDIEQDVECATLIFADGTKEQASVVVACDGIHSAIRRKMLGAEDPAATPQFVGSGAYRAVMTMAELEGALGSEIANTSTLWMGPDAYVTMYPVEGREKVNIGLWPRKAGSWKHREWVLTSQRAAMETDFREWGAIVHKIMDLMEDPPFSAAFYHASQPETVVDRRLCLIGDAAHAMPPHQGAGAGQAMEDSLVLAEVLGEVKVNVASGSEIKQALKAYERVRTARSQKVLETSVQAMDFWSDFHRQDVTVREASQFAEDALERFQWIWHDDLAEQCRQAKDLLNKPSSS